MPYSVEATPEFLSEAKKLAKKYPSIKTDISDLAYSLSSNPSQGTALGNNIYRFAWQLPPKRKGKVVAHG